MTKLRHNVIANFGGQAWGLLMSLAFVPVYIRVLGIEAYGLIGFFLSLQAFFLVLDMGLAATVNRELARTIHTPDASDGKRDLVRTLEWVYWPTGLLIACAVYILGEPIARHWLNPVSLGTERAAHAIALMGLAAGLQWPFGLYSGGLRGLERQVALNGLSVVFATFRSVGAVAVILFYSPTLSAFLWWQALAGALQTLACGGLLWRLLPRGTRHASFNLTRLIAQRRFALGMSGIVAVSFLLTQSDRLILSSLLSLKAFGYYTLAATVAFAMSAVVAPFFNALYPRFSRLVAEGERKRLIELYHQSSQSLAVVVSSVASVLAFFSGDILRLWTHNEEIAAKSGPILSILVIGTAFNGLVNLPYALQLAYGWTRFTLYQNLIAVMFVVPAIWWLGSEFGALGAATVWAALNLAYVVVGVPLMHRRLLRGELSPWFRRDIIPPAITAIGFAGALRLATSVPSNRLQGILALAIIGIITLAAAALVTQTTRSLVIGASKVLATKAGVAWPR